MVNDRNSTDMMIMLEPDAAVIAVARCDKSKFVFAIHCFQIRFSVSYSMLI